MNNSISLNGGSSVLTGGSPIPATRSLSFSSLSSPISTMLPQRGGKGGKKGGSSGSSTDNTCTTNSTTIVDTNGTLIHQDQIKCGSAPKQHTNKQKAAIVTAIVTGLALGVLTNFT